MFYVINLRNARLFLFCCLIALAAYAIMERVSAQREPDRETGPADCLPILIIDPGHGGEDGGAVTDTGLLESTVNWDIARRLETLAGFFGLKTVMTREQENIVYPETAGTTAARKAWETRERVARINAVTGGVLVSIHQNKYPGTQPFGAQVLYARDEVSRTFGELTHANLVSCLDPTNRRVAAPIQKDVYVMQHAECPAILVECGFFSNPKEAQLLGSEEYRLKLAAVLAGSYIQFFNASEVNHES
jgi:N-acetylmuramoyl-L-alanine amidase